MIDLGRLGVGDLLALEADLDPLLAALGHVPDPVAWVEAETGPLWSKQREILESVRDNRFTAVPACHGPGKSYVAARLIAWWVGTAAPGEAFAVTTAPTARQVRAILWKELRRAHRAARLPGRLLESEWKIGGEPVALGMKPADYSPDAFQGIHAARVLVVIDEADGIPPELYDAAMGLVTTPGSRMLAIGNPVSRTTRFAQACRPGSAWHVIRIPAWSTPNFTGEDVPAEVARAVTSTLWVEERRAEWGEQSALWQSRVEAVPPEQDDGVIPLSWVERCQRLELEPDGEVELGVDVGAGGDRTVIWSRRGPVALRSWSTGSADPEHVAGTIVEAIRQSGARLVKVDAIGVGWGIVGALRHVVSEQALPVKVQPVNVAERALDAKRQKNKRSELWWMGRELSRDGAWDLSAVDDRTVAELVEPKWSLDTAGRVVVEPKDRVIERLGRSPDSADALLLAFGAARRRWAAY